MTKVDAFKIKLSDKQYATTVYLLYMFLAFFLFYDL